MSLSIKTIMSNNMFTLSTGDSDFSDYVEKLNEKTWSWNKKWMVLENSRIYFLDKKPSRKFF
jgi:hypothetical protein